jgi:hypothetical protein
MRSNGLSDDEHPLLDLARDIPTTPEDVRVLSMLRRQSANWLDLPVAQIEAMIPAGALERRPPAPATRRPFTLDPSDDTP